MYSEQELKEHGLFNFNRGLAWASDEIMKRLNHLYNLEVNNEQLFDELKMMIDTLDEKRGIL